MRWFVGTVNNAPSYQFNSRTAELLQLAERVSVTWHQSWSPSPAQVNSCRLLVLPLKTSSYTVLVSAHTVSVPVRQTSNATTAAWTRVSFSVFHTLLSSAAVHWWVRTAVRQGNETMHAARRPIACSLYRGHYVPYNIAIWNATIYRLVSSAMIWSLI